jgi:hypothetical protein
MNKPIYDDPVVAEIHAIALIVERFVGIFVRDETTKIVTESRVKKSSMDMMAKAEVMASLTSVPAVNKSNVDAVATDFRTQVSNAERKMSAAEKVRSPKFQRIAVISGVVVAAFGFRFFGEIAQVVDAEPIAASIFYIADVGLSGVLIGGGSSLVDDVILNLKKSG